MSQQLLSGIGDDPDRSGASLTAEPPTALKRFEQYVMELFREYAQQDSNLRPAD
ncbi:uncharacterized protein METZ01_LOCUS383877 [marine metagenome]|uniref:Uncharacterized protein n=1 Tax=marine metagenome TaxID=408172 RepID=A0A382U9T5_9ZZZZ